MFRYLAKYVKTLFSGFFHDRMTVLLNGHWGHDVLSAHDVDDGLRVLMFPQLLYVLEVVPGEQFVEQALHTGEVGTAVLVEELLSGGYLGAIDGVVGL